MQPQLDAVHAGEHSVIATLPVCDSDGHIMCDHQGVSLALHALYYGHRTLATAIVARCQHIDHFTAAAVDDTQSLTRALHQTPALVHALSGDGFHLLGLACFFAATACVRICIAHGADVNRASQNAFAVAPIHSATAADNIVICQLLLDAGADVNQPQQQNFRALHNAAQHGNRALCALLIAYGADITAQTDAGQTAAMIAHAHQHTHLNDLLCEKG